MDVDGTLTDGKIYMGENGEIMKAFHVKDGYGIRHILPACNIVPIVLTGRQSVILESRCRELGITELHQNIAEKPPIMEMILEKKGYLYENAAYIGDDINDLPCMEQLKKHGGKVGCPQDAIKEVKKTAHFISSQKGGYGAVREFIEWIRNYP